MRPRSRSLRKVKSGEYLAPVGQMLQVSQRWQGARPSYGSVVLATGLVQKGIPLFSPHSLSWTRFQERGMGRMGYGFDRRSSSPGPCSPPTPIRSSASW